MEDNINNSLTDEERQILLNAAKTRRAKTEQDSQARKAVTKEEYAERLKLSRLKDKNALASLRETNIRKYSHEWAKIVGETFAPADTNLPAVEERVERLRTNQGLHKTSIVFQGEEYGRGKTWNAFAYVNKLVHQGIFLPGQIYHGTESSTLAHIASSGFEKGKMMSQLIGDRTKKVFFIDDVGLGTYYRPDQREAAWYTLVDHIYVRRLTLILTTNLPFTEQGLGHFIGARAFDRLRSLVGNDGVIIMRGENRREQVFIENEKNYKKAKIS